MVQRSERSKKCQSIVFPPLSDHIEFFLLKDTLLENSTRKVDLKVVHPRKLDLRQK